MKTFFRPAGAILMIAACVAIVLLASCKKDNDDNNNSSCQCWNENWLLGTWEGTTPSSIQPFANTKIRIVFDKVNLEVQDTISGNTRKIWAYSGTMTWDPDNAAWNMPFTHANYPLPDINIIIWECVTVKAAGQTVSNISLRVSDTTSVDPYHSINLDWGQFMCSGDDSAPAYFDLYGDVQIETGGSLQRADYPPDAGSMIRMTKK